MKISKGAPKMADSILKTRSLSLQDMFPTQKPEDKEPEKLQEFAEGGEVKKPEYVKKDDKGFGSVIMEADEDDGEEHHKSIAEAIRSKSKKKFADGGMVEDLKENYSDSDFSHLDDVDVPEEEPEEDDSKMSIAQKIRRKK